MCPDLLSSFLRHAHFHQITPAPAEVSKSQSAPCVCVCACVCACARTHTHTHTYTACPPERRRTGASTQTLLALGCTRVEWKDSGEENSDATQRSPEKWVSGRPPWEGKEKGLGKEKKRRENKRVRDELHPQLLKSNAGELEREKHGAEVQAEDNRGFSLSRHQ